MFTTPAPAQRQAPDRYHPTGNNRMASLSKEITIDAGSERNLIQHMLNLTLKNAALGAGSRWREPHRPSGKRD
jgi:hypothetical protein